MAETAEPIMTASHLKTLLDAALERGLHPETAVVVATDGWYLELHADVCDPTDPGEGEGYAWFTLNPAGEADTRATPYHLDTTGATE